MNLISSKNYLILKMAKEYICELCKKIFRQKVDLTRHQNKKAPCININEMKTLIEMESKDKRMADKRQLINVFKNCLDVLRDNEGLTGEKALRNMSYFLILKLIEPHLGGEIDIDNYDYKLHSKIEDEFVEQHRKKLLEIVRFSKLCEEKQENITKNIKILWEDILAVHPSTRNIFLKDKCFDIQHQTTYKKILGKLRDLDLSNTEYDILGNAYEEVVQDIMTGKVLGQFFTPPSVKKLMVKMIDPKMHSDGKIDTCCDPTMGTGGFLITYLQYLLAQSKSKNIKPDWNFIKNEGLYGKELEPDTYQLAVSNMLISSGHMFEELERGDSIRQPITMKFDNVLANPPFGINGLKYDDFNNSIKRQYIPIKTDNAVSLFIQAIIYMLKVDGKCAIVLPYGQDLFSKTNNTLVAIREYLMKTCDLKEIVHLPSGIFTYTTIKTCIFFFVKKVEGSEALTITDKHLNTRSQKTARSYKFSARHQTKSVKFYDYDLKEHSKKFLLEVDIEKIVEKSYSLNYSEYRIEQEEKYNREIEIKTIGEICEFLPKSKRNASFGKSEGSFPFYTSSQYCTKYCDEYDYKEECLIIGSGGNANIKYDSKFSCSTDNFVIKVNSELIILKYIYYYLYLNIEVLQKGFAGVGIQHISKDYIKSIPIPIPSLPVQERIVKYLDFIYEKSVKTALEKIDQLKKANDWCLENQKMSGKNEIKLIGELCKIDNGKRIVKNQTEKGQYPVLGGGGYTTFFTNEYTRDGKTCKISREGMSLHNCVMILNEKYYLNSQAFTIESDSPILINEYLWYYLDNNKHIVFNCGRGTAQKAIDINEFRSIQIPIPSLNRQQEIVQYCERSETLIKSLEKQIEIDKQQASDFIKSVIHFQQDEAKDPSNTGDTLSPVEIATDPLEEKIPISPKHTIESLTLLNLTQLKNIAKDLKIPRYSTFKSTEKNALIQLILKD